MALVSIIIPCYRQAQFLGEAIRSAAQQSHREQEIIVVNDGSPDHTSAVVQEYSQVRYLEQSNRGRSAARNRGLQDSRGTYVVFLDADDRLLPHHLETNLDVIRRHPEVALVCGDYQWFGAKGVWHKHNCQPEPDHYGSLLRGNFRIALHTAMFRRQTLLELNGFCEDLPACEDLHLFLRLAKRYPLVCHHTTIAEYRRHAAQTTKQNAFMLTWMMKVLSGERLYARQHPQYREAYRTGIRYRAQAWGEPLLWDMVSGFRNGTWNNALYDLTCLLRYYPQGLAELFLQKMGLSSR